MTIWEIGIKGSTSIVISYNHYDVYKAEQAYCIYYYKQ